MNLQRSQRPRLAAQRGFTLIEIMVVLTISAVLTTLAAPSFKRLMQSNQIAASVNGLLGDVRFARSEAMKRGGNILICRSDTPEAAGATCAPPAAGTAGWASGWIVFHDLDGDGDRGADEPVLKVTAAAPATGKIQFDGPAEGLRFTATGRTRQAGGAVSLIFGDPAAYATDMQRLVCLDASGRAYVAGDGAATCEEAS